MTTFNARGFTAAACAAAFVSGCSGGSIGSTPPGPGLIPVNSATQTAYAPRATATLRVKITVPKPRPHAIDPHYMSKATKGVWFAFKGASKYDAAFPVTPGSKGCSTKNGVTKCTFNLKLATGKYKGTVSAYDLAPVKGAIPRNANLLSTDANVPFTIAAGRVNRAGFVFGGVVSSIALSTLPSGTIGTAFTSPQPFSVTAQDADGNIIIGTYDNPITLNDSDTSGATSVSSALLSSKDKPTLSYTGGAIVSAVISASASGVTTSSGLFAPAPSVTSMSATGGFIGTSVSETLHGHFLAGGMHVVAVSGITVTGLTSTASSVTATFLIDAEAATGTRDITVSTGAAGSVPQTFTVSNANVDVVTKNSDTNPGSPPGTGTGASGDLRYAMLNAHAGDTIVFDTAAICGATSCTITLGGPLPPIAQNLTVDGGWFRSGSPRITIDGANTYRAFWAESGTITLANLEIANAKAQGGSGGGGGDYTIGGGGGAGLGAGLFVNTASVTVMNDYFVGDAVAGGDGGPSGTGGGDGGGGGGLGGSGGLDVFAGGGGGGGGILAPGAGSSVSRGGDGGAGFTNGGGTGGSSNANGNAGAGGAGSAGSGGGGGGAAGCLTAACMTNGASGGSGGSGGFGGGGGGGGHTNTRSTSGSSGGDGGFGGGGGGAGSAAILVPGGNGGAGGGGGAGSVAGSGGSLSSSLSGGSGDTSAQGGGGAAAGPAIFVTTGSLTTSNSGASGSTATPGAAGGGSATNGGADPTPVFNYGGTVNGVSVTAGNGGPVANALGSSAPQFRQRETRRRKKRH